MAFFSDPVAERLNKALTVDVIKDWESELRGSHGEWTKTEGEISGKGKEIKMDGKNRGEVYHDGKHLGRVSYDDQDGKWSGRPVKEYSQHGVSANSAEDAAERLHQQNRR